MTFEDFENIFTLTATIVGLLYCLFKYIERPKRRYLYLVISDLHNVVALDVIVNHIKEVTKQIDVAGNG